MTRFDGADLSHHNDEAGPIDWPALRANSWWVATKATQGVAFVDPTFAPHWAEMGIGFTHRLAYHWLSPNLKPSDQARHFLSAVPSPFRGGVMLDAEELGIYVGGCLEWCETVEAVTLRPCAVYTGAYTAGGTIWQSTRLRNSKYGPRPMHLAAYTSEAHALALPGVAAYPWSAWQYSSDGPVPGVTGRCDMNRIDNRDHYDLACGANADTIQPIGDDMITANDICKAEESPGDKFVLMHNGRLRAIGQVELRLLGIPLTLDLGKSVNAADRATLGAYVEPGTSPTQFTGGGTITWAGKAQ